MEQSEENRYLLFLLEREENLNVTIETEKVFRARITIIHRTFNNTRFLQLILKLHLCYLLGKLAAKTTLKQYEGIPGNIPAVKIYLFRFNSLWT